MKRIIIQLDPAVLTRLQALSGATGNSVAAIIRHCIDKRLPELEVRLLLDAPVNKDEAQS